MIEFVEVQQLPLRCQECQEVKEFGADCACYNCDYALERFEIKEIDEAQKVL